MIVTSFVCIAPLFISLFVIDQLPTRIPIRWGVDGEVATYGNTTLTLVGLPLFFLTLNLITHLLIMKSTHYKKQANAINKLAPTILSLVSVIVTTSIIMNALKYDINIIDLVGILVSLIFITLGNYTPKIRHNYLMGISLPWTLEYEQNWKRTHRITGYVWTSLGVMLLLTHVVLVLSSAHNIVKSIAMLTVIAISILFPLLFSFNLYIKNENKL